jgi:hypothetical protein
VRNKGFRICVTHLICPYQNKRLAASTSSNSAARLRQVCRTSVFRMQMSFPAIVCCTVAAIGCGSFLASTCGKLAANFAALLLHYCRNSAALLRLLPQVCRISVFRMQISFLALACCTIAATVCSNVAALVFFVCKLAFLQ